MSNEENYQDKNEEIVKDINSIVMILLKYPKGLDKIENLTNQIIDYINKYK